jgi:branched-chain amino acid transport system ATP-binding protein
LGMTLLVIEQDVPFVTGVSDYMYVIDRGKLLADGTPTEIQRNPAVVAAYLGQVTEDADMRRDAIELA